MQISGVSQVGRPRQFEFDDVLSHPLRPRARLSHPRAQRGDALTRALIVLAPPSGHRPVLPLRGNTADLPGRSVLRTLVGRRPGPLEDAAERVSEQKGLALLAEPERPCASDEGGAARASHLRRRPRRIGDRTGRAALLRHLRDQRPECAL